MSTSSPLIQARGLTKDYGPFRAVDDISFDIQPGEVVGFLGPNGAGKTTTIRMLLNLLNITKGELTLFGTNFETSRSWILSQMNSTAGTTTLPGKLSVYEVLLVFADLYALPDPEGRVEAVLNQFDLQKLRGRGVFGLSTGQQVRVSLAKAFLNKPKILLLDEPTASLDPDVGRRTREYLNDVVRRENTTVFLTSHNMREVEDICSRVLFINHGKIQAEGTPRELAKNVRRSKLKITTDHPLEKIPRALQSAQAELIMEGSRLEVELEPENVGPLLTQLIQDGLRLKTISVEEPTLEDFFIHLARSKKS